MQGEKKDTVYIGCKSEKILVIIRKTLKPKQDGLGRSIATV
jgi:hypothetical protein